MAIISNMVVDKSYTSSDPVALMDTEVKEVSHLTRVSDEAADFFYKLTCAVSPFFERRMLTRGTPQRAYNTIVQSSELMDVLLTFAEGEEYACKGNSAVSAIKHLFVVHNKTCQNDILTNIEAHLTILYFI